MPGESEIVLKCPECGAITRYSDVYQHGQLSTNHKLDCKAQFDAYPKMYLTSQAKNPSK